MENRKSKLDRLKSKLIWIRVFKYMLVCVLFVLCFLFIFTGYNYNSNLYIGLVTALLPIFLLIFIAKKIVLLKKEITVLKTWGKCPKKRYSKKDYSIYYENIKEDPSFTIDDQSSDDLDIDSLFQLINNTTTVAGRNVLYSILRIPLFDKKALLKRHVIISELQDHSEIRDDILHKLLDIGNPEKDEITKFLYVNIPYADKKLPLYIILAILSLGAFFLPLFLPIQFFLLTVITLFCLNLFLHYNNILYISAHIESYFYLTRMIKIAKQILQKDILKSEDPEKIRFDIKQTERVNRHAKILNIRPRNHRDFDINSILEFLKLFFLMDLIAFNLSIMDIRRNIKSYRNIYIYIGTIDTYCAAASYREYIQDYTIPIITEKEISINAKKMYHPFLTDPVSNSIQIDGNGVIITGSNMAGKSTFLRTIGINTIMAQSLCTCFAEHYTTGFFRIMSSIRKGDNIDTGKSFYFLEAERIYKMINRKESEVPLLCIIDELLSGTNSLERINASIAILQYLIEKKMLTVSATHDIKIAKTLKDNYKCYYFSDKLNNGELEFDYNLKEGIISTTNAINLLEKIGYPKRIINDAKKLIYK